MTVMILFPLEQLASDLGKWLKTIRFFGKTNLSPCKYMHIIFCKQSMYTKHCSINYCIHLSFSFLDPLFPTNLINVAGWWQTIEFVRSLSTNTDPLQSRILCWRRCFFLYSDDGHVGLQIGGTRFLEVHCNGSAINCT